MSIFRVYSGDNGESHFEDLTPEQFAEIANRRGPGDISLNQRPSDYFSDYHNAPRLQYVMTLAGRAELEVADGSKRPMGPGDGASTPTGASASSSTAARTSRLLKMGGPEGHSPGAYPE